jgi:hypothetical protein
MDANQLIEQIKNSNDTFRRHQCRHTLPEGRRCGSPAMRGEKFCYYHHAERKPVADPRLRQARRCSFSLAQPSRHPGVPRRDHRPHRPKRHRPPTRRTSPLRPSDRHHQPQRPPKRPAEKPRGFPSTDSAPNTRKCHFDRSAAGAQWRNLLLYRRRPPHRNNRTRRPLRHRNLPQTSTPAPSHQPANRRNPPRSPRPPQRNPTPNWLTQRPKTRNDQYPRRRVPKPCHLDRSAVERSASRRLSVPGP